MLIYTIHNFLFEPGTNKRQYCDVTGLEQRFYHNQSDQSTPSAPTCMSISSLIFIHAIVVSIIIKVQCLDLVWGINSFSVCCQ